MRPARKNNSFYCGTSNVVLPVPNKSHFPPAYQGKSRLSYYSSLFPTVEINSSFYKIPQQKTTARWSQETDDRFLFTFKLWRGITHAKQLTYNTADISRFVMAIDGVGAKKGCILVQFPASIKFSFHHKVQGLLGELFSATGCGEWRMAVEFRDQSWYNDTVYQMLEKYRAAAVTHDMPASATPANDMDAGFSYFRFHGEKGDYKGTYERDALLDHAMSIAHNLKAGMDVFAYFNNTMGSAVSNAIDLQKAVSGTKKIKGAKNGPP